MQLALLDIFTDFAKGLSFDAAGGATTSVVNMAMNPAILASGVGLIIISIIIFFVLKKILEHIIIGAISWVLAVVVFHIQLPLIPSFVVSVIFGPAGLGVMLLLKFLGIIP
ncbi:MAG: hypothetical protein NTY48_06920 [Candidatus Diapherotrites archaeon]|nr:hypothetical protein [Candidatus Diapherotrites archaeon]